MKRCISRHIFILSSSYIDKLLSVTSIRKSMTQYVCLECGWIYDEALGFPERGIAPGTVWSQLPDDFKCGECEVTKGEMHMWQKLG